MNTLQTLDLPKKNLFCVAKAKYMYLNILPTLQV